MEAFAIATSIAGLLSLSMELTYVIGGYINGVKGARKTVEELMKKLFFLTEVLKKFESFLQTEREKGSSLEYTSRLQSDTKACEEKLQKLSRKLKKHTEGTKLSQTVQRLKWPIADKETRQIVADVEGYIQVLHLSLNIDNFVLQSKTSGEVAQIMKRVSEILEIVSPLVGMPQQMSNLAYALDAPEQRPRDPEYRSIHNEESLGRDKIQNWLSSVWPEYTQDGSLNVGTGEEHDSLKMLLNLWTKDMTESKTSPTSLALAALEGDERTVRLLLDRGFDGGVEELSTALRNAVSQGHHGVIRLLLDSAVEINVDHVYHDSTALMTAAQQGDEKTVQMLLEHGANVHDDYGRYAINLATENGHTAVVTMLKESKKPRQRRHSTRLSLHARSDFIKMMAPPTAFSAMLPPSPPASVSSRSRAPSFTSSEDTLYIPPSITSPRTSSFLEFGTLTGKTEFFMTPLDTPPHSRPTTPSSVSRSSTTLRPVGFSEVPPPASLESLTGKLILATFPEPRTEECTLVSPSTSLEPLAGKCTLASHSSMSSVNTPVTASWVPSLKTLYPAPTIRRTITNVFGAFC